MSELRCDDCGRRSTIDGSRWRCACGGPLTLSSPGEFDPRALRSRPYDMWRYREAIALGPHTEPVTLGEGFTPIVDREIQGIPARFKLEFLMPTGSFKDRGASVVVTRLAASGTGRAVEDSSGNAGLALAAYGSRAGIRMDIVVPEDAPPAKVLAIEASGGTVIRVPGGRQAAAETALRQAESGIPFASHVWNPFFIEGTRTFAFEIWEQTDPDLPARVFIPAGNGTLLIGACLGFLHLERQGLIAAMPRLIAVQPAAFASLARDGADGPGGSTIADGLRIAKPVRLKRMLDAIRQSRGEVLTVDDDEIEAAQKELGLAGLDVEPSGAVGWAGARQWMARDAGAHRAVEREGAPCVALTGSGLKVHR